MARRLSAMPSIHHSSLEGHSMLQQRRHRSRFDVGLGLVVALASTFMACGFYAEHPASNTPKEIHDILNTAPYEDLTESQRATYIEVPGLLKVQHRLGCAQADKAADENSVGLRIHEMAVIPPGYNTGTVFLNGWRLRYKNGDHHVRGLGSAIFNITQTQNGDQQELHWEAGGVVSDDDGDDPYEWCGIYTLLFWHRNKFDFTLIPPQIAAWPSHTDVTPEALTFVHSEGSDPDNDTARRELPGAVQVTGPHAVLPRAFGFVWGSDTDHHLLQAGFDLGTPVPSGDTISWTSITLWKDNSTRDDYYGSAIVSVLSGPSVNMWHPDTVLRWRGSSRGWLPEANTVPLTPNNDAESDPLCEPGGVDEMRQEQFKVENVPFYYAVPVLTGWQLEYLQSDHHVETIGVWIKGFSYEKAPGAATGTLFYMIESTLVDDPVICPQNKGLAQYKVSVLGLNPTALPPKQTVSNGPALQLPDPGLTPEPPPDDPPVPPSDDPPVPPPICRQKPWTPGCEDF
jgi:hypothetical protein